MSDHPIAAESLPDTVWLRIRDLVHQASGIDQDGHRFNLLVSRASRRMKAVGVVSPLEYLSLLIARTQGRAEMANLLNEITIGGTSFFRSLPQLEALRKIVIPSLAEARTKPDAMKLRFWSAGCSTGEEAYTLAMVLLEEAQVALRGREFEVLATDLNTRFLAKAWDGIYTGHAMRNVPVDFAEKYFTKIGSMFRVADSVRQFVSFRQLNLSDAAEILPVRAIDAIFCCNALIYFDRESKARAIRNFYDALLPTGYFFLGPSESLSGINEKFRPVHFPRAAAYLKSEPSSGYRIDSARSPD